MTVPPFERAYVVTPQFAAGRTFVGATTVETVDKLVALQECGIATIVSLLGRGEVGWTRNALAEADMVKAGISQAFHHHYFPVVDGTAPGIAQTSAILDLLNEEIGQQRPVYVHCVGGRGRTGTVVGCWLVQTKGLDGPAALKHLNEVRLAAGLDLPSPETEEQFARIQNWTSSKSPEMGRRAANAST